MLTTDQIKEIYYFVRSKYVKYYDLQLELVHQLVRRVEDQLELNPELSFESALKKVYAGFGVYGFSKVIMRKEAVMGRQSIKLWIREFVQWFTLSKVIGTVLLFLLLWLICKSIPITYVAIALIVFCVLEGMLLHFKGKHSILHNRAPLLMLVPFRISFFQLGFSIGFLPLYLFVISNAFNLGTLSQSWIERHSWIVALWVVISLLFMASHLAVYQRVLLRAKKKYPGLFIEV